MSQFDMRSTATPGVKHRREDSQLLIDVNDVATANAIKLTYEKWTGGLAGSYQDFTTWLKTQLRLGRPIVTVLFHRGGTQEYDHIVLLKKVSGTDSDIRDSADQFCVDDHYSTALTCWPSGTWAMSRSAANAGSAPEYSLPNNYFSAIAFKGIVDDDSSSLRIFLASSVKEEVPIIEEGWTVPPEQFPVTLTGTVSGLVSGDRFVLCLYYRFSYVPTSNFKACNSSADVWATFTATGPTYSFTRDIMSQDIRIYRAALCPGCEGSGTNYHDATHRLEAGVLALLVTAALALQA